MKILLEYLVKNIVNHPQEVLITTKEENGTETYFLEVNPEDIGKVIGKNGKTIRAIRSVLYLKAKLENKRVNLNLVEEKN